jgi:hypothetical protein
MIDTLLPFWASVYSWAFWNFTLQHWLNAPCQLVKPAFFSPHRVIFMFCHDYQNIHILSEHTHIVRTYTYCQNIHIFSEHKHIVRTYTYCQNIHILSEHTHIVRTYTYSQNIHIFFPSTELTDWSLNGQQRFCPVKTFLNILPIIFRSNFGLQRD